MATVPALTDRTLAARWAEVRDEDALDDSARLREWLERGAIGEPPAGTTDTLVAAALYAMLPDWFFDAFDSLLSGEVPPGASLPVEDFVAAFMSVAGAAAPAASRLLADPAPIRTADAGRLLRGLRINEWAARVFAGLDEVPVQMAALGGPDAVLRSLLSNLPDAVAIPELLDGPDSEATEFVQSLTRETIDDWHDSGRLFRDHVHTVRLLHRALGGQGLTPAEKAALLDSYAATSGFRPQVPLSAAEIAERARPLLAAAFEGELASARSWPLRRSAPAGLYVRAMAALWADLTEMTPPVLCATPSCGVAVPPTRNRRHCDSCRASRRRQSVRRSRARLAGPPRLGGGALMAPP